MQLNIHDSTLKRIGFINNDLPDALHYFNDNWHRYLAEGTSTFDFSVNKVNPDYALLTLQSYISFTYDSEDYLFNIINIEQDHETMQLQSVNLNIELIKEESGAYSNAKRHSIVWYLKNVAKITDDFVEIGNNPFPLADEDSANPILSFDSSETKLARIISICNSFNAEFQFKTQLKNDGTLQNITIDLYKEGGVGQKRKDVTLYYGKNISGITSKADRTSTFFNATTVTDSKKKYKWLSVEGKHYNSEGQLEFYKDAGNNTAYAPLSRDMFPSQIKSSSSDRYTRKDLSIEASSENSLWDYAVNQFKLYAYPKMSYEVSVSANAVTNALGNERKLDIGDTIIVQDSTFDKSDGGLILSARVSEQEISFTNPLNNKITFTNFVRLKSDISADLYGRMKDLVDENTPYRAELETTNGIQFKNGVGSTTLTARIYKGSEVKETIADSYSWSKDGNEVANAQSITIDGSSIIDKSVFVFTAKINDNIVASQSVTITNVNDGAKGAQGPQGPQGPQGLKGDPGATGIPGQAGADGKTSYLHIAYATNSTGTAGFDVSNATGKTYIGQYTDFTSADSTDPSKYTWSLIKGDKGDKGDTGPQGPQGERGIAGATGAIGSPGPKGADGRSSYIHIKYAPVINPTDSQITDTPNAYIGVYTDYNQADSTSASAYTWSKWQGEDGANGVAGAKGADGRTTYVHFAYANSTNGQTNFSTSYFDGALYMGTLTDYTQTDSTNYAAYTWSRLKGDKGDKGDQGVQGIQGLQGPKGDTGIAGPKGADGKTQYTHIAYANSADGVTDFSTSDSNRTYIGMYVDFNINDSTTPSDYSWTLVKGADGTQGTPGKPGADGKTPYFHTAWSYSADGTDGFTTVYPNLNLLDGTKYFKTISAGNNTESQNAGEIYFTQHKKVADLFKAGDYIIISCDVEFLNTELYSSSNDTFMRIQTYGGAYTWLSVINIKNVDGRFYTKDSLKDSDYIENPTHKLTVSRTIQLTQDFINVNATVNRVHVLYHYIPVGANVRVTKLKIEPGSTATPYMPSSSEAKTADYPSYIGQYTDFAQADSTNPSDYTWSLMRGNDGKDGEDGKDGRAGKDGVGIKTTVITYAISTSGTTAPTTSWTSSVPSLVKGQYLWTKTVWTYTDNSIETGYSVTYIAKDGNNGNDGIAGKDGTGIKTTTITYAGSTSGTTAPTSGWTSTVPTVAAGSYLWTKTVWAYTDNTSETGYSVAKMGNTGATGPQGPQGNTGPQGPAGSNGDPGKVVSDTEPTTRFKGLTWKYSGTAELTASDGTVIKPNTEYYYDGTHWIINLIEANQLNVNDLSAISGTYTNGSIKNVTTDGSVTSTILIEKKHILFTFSDSSQNTTNTLELDSQQGYANTFVDSNSGRTRTVQANFQGFFTSDTDGPSAQLTPYGVYVTNGLQTTTVSLGSGINATLAKIGQMCQISINSNSSNVPAGNGVALSGNIPAGWRPAIGTPFEVMMYSGTTFQRPLHITIGTDGKLSIVNASASSYWCFGGTVYMLA